MSPKCLCMPSDSGPGAMASRQFAEPPCPCTMCKKRAMELQSSRVQAFASSKNGICGQSINGTFIGKKTHTEAGPFSHSGQGISFEESCGCSPGKGAVQGSPMGSGPGSARPRPVPGGVPPNSLCVNGKQGMGAEMLTGKGPHVGPETTGPQMGRGVGPGVKPGMGPAVGPGLNPEMNQPIKGYDPTDSNLVAFGAMVFGRQSSMAEDSPRLTYQRGAGCTSSTMWNQFEDDTAASRYDGRDTLGLPLRLQGNSGVLNAAGNTLCSDMVHCDADCGTNTGCEHGCRGSHAVPPGAAPGGQGMFGRAGKGGRGGRGGQPSGHTSGGIRVCSNEYINMIVTFLMEVLGILVFFAICTLTFWITVGYYIVQLLIDLKNADRYVQVAIATAVGLLLIAFAITIVTHDNGSCQNRVKCLTAGLTKPGCATSRCSKPSVCNVKKVHASKCSKLKPLVKLLPKIKLPPAKSKCQSICPKKRSVPTAKPQYKPQPRPHPKRKYSDCEGRAIFDSSKRNAILIEMKQPPTWILWARDCINSYFGRD